MIVTPLLAHGGGILPLMAAGCVAFGFFAAGVVLVVTGKRQSHAFVGFALLLCSVLVVVLSLKFFSTLVRLF